MGTITNAQDRAIKELETILTDSGYVEWESVRPSAESQYGDVIRNQKDPIFYRTTTPPEAPTANIRKPGCLPNQASLFALYAPVTPEYYNADNKTRAIAVRFNITLQYNNKYLFWKNQDEKPNKFVKYLDDLLFNLESAGFSITETNAENVLESTDGLAPHAFRKIYLVTKLF